MLPKKAIHFVNGEQLCDQQYVAYREDETWRAGYRAAVKEIDEARKRIGKRFWESLTWETIQEHANKQ